MGNIIEDIVEDIQVKPSKSKLVIKWVVRISTALIGVAFVVGQYKMTNLNRLSTIENNQQVQTLALEELKKEMNAGFGTINKRIDKVYDDGYKQFSDFQDYNNKQLALIIDYGKSDKDLLKRMLELNTIEKTKNVENQIEQAKSIEPLKASVSVVDKEYKTYLTIVSVDKYDTLFTVTGATQKFIDGIKNRYKINSLNESQKFPGSYDVKYKNF